MTRWTGVLAACLVAWSLAGQDAGTRQRVSEIESRLRRGEAVTAEERALVKEAMAQARAEFARRHPPRESTGMVALSDLGKGAYAASEGGLYPGGANVPPPAHARLGTSLARGIVPRDAAGRPAPDGRIVLLSTGMSNGTQEFQAFQKLAREDPDLNPRLAIVDGAQGGQTAAVTAQPGARYWSVVAERLAAAGVTAAQVQATWIKQANAGPSAPFPEEARKLQRDLVGTLHNLRDKFPNLQAAYLSSRIYAGYATTPLNPEPHAYETGFAVKWLVAAQMEGDAALNCDPARGVVRAPWIAWGPYLWADGLKGRRDGLVYTRDDLMEDGTHPSPSGREKVAKLLLEFLKTDPAARLWFRRP